MNSTLGKSRDIEFNDYFSLLQLEYLNYFFRRELYTRECDKKKFSDICLKKREKIMSISLKNNLPSVFSDFRLREFYVEKFLNEWGIPNFLYRDDYQRKVKGRWDRIYYFYPGEAVTVLLPSGEKNGEIVSYLYHSDEVIVKIDGVKTGVSSKIVSRKFSKNFFEKLK
jgi:hypothetical protein